MFLWMPTITSIKDKLLKSTLYLKKINCHFIPMEKKYHMLSFASYEQNAQSNALLCCKIL